MTEKCCLGARIKWTDSTKFERRACWREAGRKGQWSQRGPRTKRSSSWCWEQYGSSYAHHAFQYISLTFAASWTLIYAVLKCNWQLIGSDEKITLFKVFFFLNVLKSMMRVWSMMLLELRFPKKSPKCANIEEKYFSSESASQVTSWNAHSTSVGNFCRPQYFLAITASLGNALILNAVHEVTSIYTIFFKMEMEWEVTMIF